MATERQVEANRRNATRSTGPKSPEGKARSRTNATKHGLSGESADLEAGPSPEFRERRARWAAEREPVGEAAHWALDRAVAASLRIERCEHAVDDLVASARVRAELAWDEDREVEAATTAARLGRDPVLASRQLQTTLAGVRLLIEGWFGLIATLEAGSDWSGSEAAKALDLLGVAPDLRAHRAPIDPPEGAEAVPFRKGLALDELGRLEALRDEGLLPLEEWERGRAMAGHVALLSKPAKLLLRYERDAWRRYRDSMEEVQAPGREAPAVAQPTPVIVGPPRVPGREAAPTGPSLEEGRRALLEEAAPYRLTFADLPDSVDPVEEEAWFEAMERQIQSMAPPRVNETERTRWGGSPVGAGSTGTQGRTLILGERRGENGS